MSHISYLTSHIFLLFALIVDLQAQNKPIAFPGAEGFGKYTTGGRGGNIFIVTNLNDNGPGSLREAIRKKGPRTILFAVSGTIELQSALDINNADVTIAGQSAPGEGICIKNYPMNVKADNVIIRFMRFRLGDESKQESDAITGNKGVNNIIIDHCSMSWATDECASFYRNKNFTLQWCIVAESLNQSVHTKGEHGYGGIWGGEGATFHHNLLANHTSRMPRFSGSSTTPNTENELVDFVNNVVYNWGGNNSYGGEKGRYNVMNNYYKVGPATKSKKLWILNPSSPYGKFYVTGNVLAQDERITKNNKLGLKAEYIDSLWIEKPFEVTPINMESSIEACESVLKYAGASIYRDVIDTRIVKETKSGQSSSGKNKNGIIDSQKEVGGWPVLKSTPPPTDTDQDGIPDAWETKNKLKVNEATDANVFTLSREYTNLELYLNELAAPAMKQ